MAHFNAINILRFCLCIFIIFFIIDTGIQGSEARKRKRKNRERDNSHSGRKGHKRHGKGRRKLAKMASSDNIPPVESDINFDITDILKELRKSDVQRKAARKSRRIPKKSNITSWIEANVRVHHKSEEELVEVHQAIGKFGYHSRNESVVGKVVHVKDPGRDSNLGCNSALENMHHIPENEPWIALIKRGQCQFFNKIKLGELNNASAVVIYNDRSSPSGVMNTVGTNIVSIMIDQADGERVARLVDSGKDVYMHILTGKRRSSKPKPSPTEQTTTIAIVSAKKLTLTIEGGGTASAMSRISFWQLCLLLLVSFACLHC